MICPNSQLVESDQICLGAPHSIFLPFNGARLCKESSYQQKEQDNDLVIKIWDMTGNIDHSEI